MINRKYIQELERAGIQCHTEGKSIWQKYTEPFSVVRFPCYNLSEPDHGELTRVFKALNAMIYSYAIEDHIDYNCFLYQTRNSSYRMEGLSSPVRRNIRKALRRFEFTSLDWDFIYEHGYNSYKSTRERNGLSDSTKSKFKQIINRAKYVTFTENLVAMDKDTGEIAGFLLYEKVHNGIEVFSAYAANKYLNDRPNNGLFHTLQQRELASMEVKVISYGYSSIQDKSNKDGLHQFKVKVGFEATPVQRRFILNPKYELLVNKSTHLIVEKLLMVLPKNRILRKVNGILKLIS
jgi:hypothetical protein